MTTCLNQVTSLLAQINRPGAFILFSDLFDQSWEEALNILLERGHQVVVVHVLAPDEIAPILDGDFRLVDHENGSTVEITADYETLREYADHRQEWQEAWRRFCAQRHAAYLPIASSLGLEELLFTQLPKAGVLR